jgi:NAD(P)-dependent dehydrogenase (short-subunit alcohol dehydrogenase family)
MKNPKSILITGGSSGIGRGLCIDYAGPGVTIALSGRSRERLDEAAKIVEEKGAAAFPEVIDVTDAIAMRQWIEKVNTQAPLDLVIANAGIGAPRGMGIDETVKTVFDTNVYGVFNTIHPALELMRNREAKSGIPKGQIAIVSSIAGYMGMPGSPSYSASKAALINYGLGLRTTLKREGIEISVICPGVIHTPMTESFYRRVPGWLTVEAASRIIRRGLERNRGLIAFPWYLHVLTKWASGFPEGLRDYVMLKYSHRTRETKDAR